MSSWISEIWAIVKLSFSETSISTSPKSISFVNGEEDELAIHSVNLLASEI